MTRWSLFLQTLSLLHHFLGLYFRARWDADNPLSSSTSASGINSLINDSSEHLITLAYAERSANPVAIGVREHVEELPLFAYPESTDGQGWTA